MRFRPEGRGFIVLLGALAALPPLSIDMGLPAFPALGRALAASPADVALTLSLFMAGFSVSLLVLGPLSDRIGRRPVLLGGLALYAACGALCAAATSIDMLIGLRLLQGACAASGTVMAFAIARDLFGGAAARTRIAYVSVVLSVAPIIAPTLGGWALLLGDWRAIYAGLGVAGVVLLAAVALGLGETRRVPAVRIGLLGGFAKMLSHRPAIAFALANAMSFGALFAYVSASPLVLMGRLGASAQVFGLLFAITSAGILLGATLAGRLGARGVGARRQLGAALAAALASAVALCVVTVANRDTLAVLMPLFVVHMFCRGVVVPNASHGALEPMGEVAGAASALLGFLQMATGALASAGVAMLFPRFGPLAMMLVMAGCSAAALAAWLVAERPWPA